MTEDVFPMPSAKVEFASACLVTKEMVIVAALQVTYYTFTLVTWLATSDNTRPNELNHVSDVNNWSKKKN